MKRSGWVFGVVSIIGVVGIAATTLWARPPAPTHVVLVIVCTMRKDQLTPYGGAKRATPGLARLAESGSLFESAFDAAPWTKAASTALWTGKHAITIGMTEPGEMRSLRVLPPEETTLAEHLHNAGYFTAGVTGNPNTSATFGFDQGFDEYYAGKTWNMGGGHPSGRQTFSVLLEELDKRPEGKPVFLQAMLLDPHEPVNVSANEIQSFKERGLPREVSKY
ncbi:MAG: sulfatase-like hydrolase/transferase, partial [Rhodobacterales bacterium]|nr:sulfatase-like hydrolase/transferase [Rhodobacterales bacterium]